MPYRLARLLGAQRPKRLILLNNWLFPLNKGLHRHGTTGVYVSQGAGTFGLRMRLGSRNEINLIRLRPKD